MNEFMEGFKSVINLHFLGETTAVIVICAVILFIILMFVGLIYGLGEDRGDFK